MGNGSWKIDVQSMLALCQEEQRNQAGSLLSEEHGRMLSSLLDLRLPSFPRKRIQMFSSSLYSLLGETLRLKVSSFFKRQKPSCSRLEVSLPLPIEELGEIFETVSYDGKDSAILLTHDIDYRRGYEDVLRLAELEAGRGIKASYYLLTNAGYEISPAVLRELSSMGHEVGLHGSTYDFSLAYRNRDVIFRHLEYAKKYIEDKLGKPVYGFRSHGLLLSYSLLDVLEELEFEYDSGLYPKESIDGFHLYYCWPFKYLGKNLFEIPVMWPLDTEIFREMFLGDDEALSYYEKKLALIHRLHGVACVGCHPSIMMKHSKFCEGLIDLIAGQPVSNETPHDFLQKYKHPATT